MGGDSDDRAGYLATYYPGTGNIAQAQRITIAAGQTVDGMNFTLLPVRTFKISGIVLDAQGRPLSGGFVNTITRSFMTGGGGATTRPDGKFTISGVTPGDYALRVNLPRNSESATMPITIGDADVSDVQLMTSQPPTIRGRVVLDDSAPAPKGSSLRLFVQNDLPMMASANAQVKDDFTFETTMAAGHARVTFFGGDWRLRTVRLDGADVTEAGFDVPPAGIYVSSWSFPRGMRSVGHRGGRERRPGTRLRGADLSAECGTVDQSKRHLQRASARGRPLQTQSARRRLLRRRARGARRVPSMPTLFGQLRETAQRLSIIYGETRSLVLKFSPPVVY